MAIFRNLWKEPIARIIVMLALCFLTYPFLPTSFIRGALTLSIFLKSLLMLFIPWLIISGTSIAFASFRGNGLWFVATIIGIVAVSNFCTILFSGIIACYWIPKVTSSGSFVPSTISIEPYFETKFPTLLPNTWALLIGISSGILSTFCNLSKWMQGMQIIRKVTMGFLLRIFVPTIPLFLMGFILKMLVEGQIMHFFRSNGWPCVIMFGFLYGYLSLWWFAAHKCSHLPAMTILKNIFPAIVTAAGTMSSMAALPFSLEGSTKNTKDPTLVHAVLPILLNFHMMGCTTTVAMLAVMILSNFSLPLPSLSTYLLFGIMFVLNKFAGVGIPGGTVIVSLPILQHYLGFSQEMLALIVAFFMLTDPLGTMANVTANNFLIIFIQKFLKRSTRKETLSTS
ncbi:MAG: cation:dicarboxylase symporter family transporter [Opitutales bacterium]|nr:cation:dicarboxylase symporter family transporter [Opitutales bacterium]